MNNKKIIKKDGSIEGWDGKRISDAVCKAGERIGKKVSNQALEKLIGLIKGDVLDSTIEVHTRDIHGLVVKYLKAIGESDIADSYQEYRDYKNTYAKSWEEVKNSADTILLLGDRENANFDSSLVSTKGSLIKGALTKELYKQFYLSKQEKELIKRGDIYIHDLRDMILGCFNCCLFDIGAVLDGGFEMSNVKYTEPTSVLSALQVIGDITLVATAQQFGGFTLPQLDEVLLKYCKKTYDKAYGLAYNRFDVDHWDAHDYACDILTRELEQGFQSLELKLNTIPCSRGDFAFTTITFGSWSNRVYDEDELEILELICNIILKVRQEGHGGKPVVFPKLTFLYSKVNQETCVYNRRVFDECVKCSSKCMYPDYLSIDDEYSDVARIYTTTGAVTSGMGCRAYLSEWHDPETDGCITVGRCNIGAVSLNLPVIMAYCKKTYKDSWRLFFRTELYDRLQVIRNFLKKRYDVIRHSKASSNPMAFMQGGLYKGYLKADDEVGDLVNYMTASFGITALNEASILWNGKTIKEDSAFAEETLDFINDCLKKFKEEDGYLYALYGTPAESLCGTQAKQYKEYTGDDTFGDYFTNSFHCHVSEDISPFVKQDKEFKLFHKCNGGHIQYVRIENPDNYKGLKAIIQRGMELGFYQGVNFDSAYCNDCGEHSTNVLFTCPKCGSNNLTVLSRVCGYLGYSNVNGHTRMNDSKMKEILDRKSM